MTEIVMLVWLGDVAHNVSFLFGLLLAGCVLVAAVMWVLADFYNYDYARARRLVWPVAVGATILAVVLAVTPFKGHHPPVRGCASGAGRGGDGTRARGVRGAVASGARSCAGQVNATLA